MDQEYQNSFPEPLVNVRQHVQEELREAQGKAQKVEHLEKIYTALATKGTCCIERSDQSSARRTYLRIEATISDLSSEPAEQFLKMGATAEWNEEDHVYELTHEVVIEVGP